MTYQIKTEAGKFQVVLTINNGKTIARVLNSFTTSKEAQQLLTDLSGWKM